MTTGYYLNDEDKRKIEGIYRWIRGLRGEGVTNTPDGAVIRPVGSRRGKTPVRDVTEFDAIITGSTSYATNRWAYAWSEAYDDGGELVVLSASEGGRSGTTSTDYALNTAEMFHTSTYAWGVDTTGTDYPAGFAPRPVGGGGTTSTHKYNVGVRMRQLTDPDGNTIYRFTGWGSHDGTCDA